MTVYEENGYSSRNAYLSSLSEDYGIELEIVQTVADMFGESEDFDGLVTSLEDYLEQEEWEDDIF